MRKLFTILVLFLVLISLITKVVIICRATVLGILILCIFWGQREQSFFNPYYLFAFTPLSLLIYVNVGNQFMFDLSPATWCLAIINMMAFLLSVFLTPDFKHSNNCKGPNDNELVFHSILLTLIGLFSSFFEFISGRPFFLASVLKLCSIPAIICAIKSKKTAFAITIVALFVISNIAFLSKSAVLSYVLAVLIGVDKYYFVKQSRKKYMTLLSFLGVIIMIFSFSFANKGREYTSADEMVEYYSYYGDIEWTSNNQLFMPYMYMTTPWANLQYLTETQDSRTYGLWFFRPLIGYLQADDSFRSEYQMMAYSSFNTFTFVACGYKDFGYWFSILSSIFLGFFVKKVYSRYRKSRSALDTACYACTAIAVLEMFFNNEFFTQSFPFTIIIIMELYKLVLFPRRPPQLES